MPRTPVMDALGLEHPIFQAGMARGFTNADLVAAVSGAGGLGVLGCLNRPADEVVAEIGLIRAMTDRPFGVNFVVQHMDWPAFEACVAERVPVFTFFRGEPDLVAGHAHSAGALVIYQVTTVQEAERALGAGADILIAQGAEAGGHVGAIGLSTLLPAVVEVAGGRPVLAAGGIVDGGSLAAALCLGADGAWMGTRFLATPESPALPVHKQAILDSRPGETAQSEIWDLIWGREWPGVQVRAIRNALVDRWTGREDDIPRSREEINDGMEQAKRRGDAAEMDLLAGEGAGRITTIRPAADLVREISADADRILGRLAQAT